MGVQLRASLKPPEHHDTMVPRGLRASHHAEKFGISEFSGIIFDFLFSELFRFMDIYGIIQADCLLDNWMYLIALLYQIIGIISNINLY